MRVHAAVLLGCSWVLWQMMLDVATQRTSYTVLQAEETKAACETALRAKMEWWTSLFPRQGNGVLLSATDGTPRALLSFNCLPDTVDPRGK